MRIIAGNHRGRVIVAPKRHSTRPTADRTRQALFNVLEHAPWAPGLEGARVVDLFAGSGAFGLEAISRGAAFALFVETDPAALAAIEENIISLHVDVFCEVRRADATRLATAAPFDFAFLDPPYDKGLVEPCLRALASGDCLTDGAIAIVERGANESSPASADYEVLDSRTWGAARVWFLRRPRSAGAPPATAQDTGEAPALR